jgi:hypothetical protein
MKNFLLRFTISVATVTAQQYQYTFNNTLNEFSGGPALTETLSCGAGPGVFTPNQTVTTTAGTCAGTPTVFSFNKGGGLVFPNNPSFITTSYTIHSFFKFLPFSGGYGRIFDFSNSTSDAGIYVLNNCLNFFPNGNVGPCPYFIDGNYYLLSLVRDGSTNIIKVYINGTVFGTYTDASGIYKPATATTPIIFFRDDNPVPCEDRPGNVKYISLSPDVSTDAEVAAVFANICSAIALPLTLVSFDVTKTNASNVSINWKTSQEIDIASYIIERSSDGVNFENIGRVSASGNNGSAQNYHFTDAAPVKGINYYRIQILDRNNSKKYSVIKNVRYNGNAELSVFPSPVTDIIKIKVDAEIAEKGTLTISDASGRQLHKSAIAISQGVNNISINASNLSQGTYLLKVIFNGTSLLKKFTKL